MNTAWLTIVLAGAGTFAMRASFLAAAGRLAEVPPGVQRLLRQIPSAALASLVVPAFVRPDGELSLLQPELLAGQIDGSRGWLGIYSLRMTTLAVGIVAALYFGAHPVGLLIGLSLIMPACLIEAWRTRPPVDPTAPALPEDDPAWERWSPWLAREVEEREEA